MTHRVGPKGQVVIPKEIRDRLGIRPGGEVDFVIEEESVRVLPVRDLSRWRGRFRGGPGMAAALLADRRAEERRDAGRDRLS